MIDLSTEHAVESWARRKFKITGKREGKRGINITGVCPRCKQDKWSINPRLSLHNCWREKCGYSGKLFKLVAEYEGISEAEARAALGKRGGPGTRTSAVQKFVARKRNQRRRIDMPLPAGYIRCWDGKGTPRLDPCDYLIERCTNLRAVRDMRIGICTSGREYGRIILPVACPNGTAWVGRDYTGRSKEDSSYPKYLAPKDSATEFKSLMGFSPGYVPGGDLAIVEGQWDVARFYEHELHSASLLGKEIHEEQIRMLWQYLPVDTTIILCLDPEVSAGTIRKIHKALTDKFCNLLIWEKPQYDPGDTLKEEAWQAIMKAHTWNG